MKTGAFILTIFLCFTLVACGLAHSSPEEFPLPEEGEDSGYEIMEESKNDNEEEEKTPPFQEEKAAVIAVQNTDKIYIRSKVASLCVRSKPSTSSSVFGYLNYLNMVSYIEEVGGWYRTWYRGKEAYVSASERYTELVKMKAAEDRVERVIEQGAKLLGTPYVYGAVRLLDSRGNLSKNFTSEAFDCSSLMQYIFYYGAGIVLRETTRTQVMQGQDVTKENLTRGDLIFMTNASRKDLTGTERIGHVALYLGEGYILHTASDFAVIEKMSATRWNNYICARRMF